MCIILWYEMCVKDKSKKTQISKGGRFLKGADVITKLNCPAGAQSENYTAQAPAACQVEPRIGRLGSFWSRKWGELQGEPQREEAGKHPREGGESLTMETENPCISKLLGSLEFISSNHPPKAGIPFTTSWWVFIQPCLSIPRVRACFAYQTASSIAGRPKILTKLHSF